ncbi:hypothetical protein NDU88_000991 [Pleurodeles waltl]|uniref:Uncharacterized protein n=1 Tax=Pleurodeles waltl TaxID=8319 RepID=A0AAV7SAA5_PLEWA|nr:hypothetical protein NDU88_000991 [Pleurodeles waltl]
MTPFRNKNAIVDLNELRQRVGGKQMVQKRDYDSRKCVNDEEDDVVLVFTIEILMWFNFTRVSTFTIADLVM